MPEQIEQQMEFEGVRLSWPLPTFGASRYILAAFFAIITLVWAFGLFGGVKTLVHGRDPMMCVWIATWLVGGGWGPLCLWGILRRRPESVILGNELIYDRGWEMASPVYLAVHMTESPHIFPAKPVVVPKAELEIGEGKMGFQHRGKRVEIGIFLPAADREWLIAELERWKG